MGVVLKSKTGRKVSLSKTGGKRKLKAAAKVLKTYVVSISKNGAVRLSEKRESAKPAKKSGKKAAAPKRRKLRKPRKAAAPKRRVLRRAARQLELF